MLRTWATSGVTDGIKVERASSIDNNVTGEWNTSNVDEIKQRGTTYCMDSIKEERDSPDMDNIRESFTCDRNDMKEKDTYNYMNDMNEEGIRHCINNIRENYNYDNIDIQENMVAQYMRNIGEWCTFDTIDNKEEGISQNMDDIGKDCGGEDIDIEEEDTSGCMDDIEEGISYNIGGTERQEQHEAHKQEMTGCYDKTLGSRTEAGVEKVTCREDMWKSTSCTAEEGSLLTERSSHKSKTLYPCCVCRKSFTRTGDLTRHMGIHTGSLGSY